MDLFIGTNSDNPSILITTTAEFLLMLPFEETDLDLPVDIPRYTIGLRSRRLLTIPLEPHLPNEG